LRNKAALSAGAAVAAALVLAVLVLAVSVVLIRQEQAATEQAKGEKEEEYRGRIAALEGETKALGRETEALGKEKKALESWRNTSYFLGIGLAFNEYNAGNTARANQLLDECPVNLRHWEWHYLKRLCNSELATDRVSFFPERKVFRPGGGQLAVVSAGKLNVCNLPPKTVLVYSRDNAYTAHGDPAYSANGRFVAVAAQSGDKHIVRIWEAATGKEVAELKAANAAVELKCVALSPEGKWAAATDGRGKLFLWEVASGRQELIIDPALARLGHLLAGNAELFGQFLVLDLVLTHQGDKGRAGDGDRRGCCRDGAWIVCNRILNHFSQRKQICEHGFVLSHGEPGPLPGRQVTQNTSHPSRGRALRGIRPENGLLQS
jgi:hypothetical protein